MFRNPRHPQMGGENKSAPQHKRLRGGPQGAGPDQGPSRSVAHFLDYVAPPVAMVKNAAINAETDTKLFATCMITPAHNER